MKMNGSYLFQTARERVFAALIDPMLLQKTIPGCEAVWYSTGHGDLKVRLVTPVPGLEGPYDVTITVLEREEPHMLVLQAGRSGRIGGRINTVTHLTLSGGSEETLLIYETTAELEGPIAVVNNPLFQKMAKHSLKTFFKNLNAALVTPA